MRVVILLAIWIVFTFDGIMRIEPKLWFKYIFILSLSMFNGFLLSLL